jgi:D-3-phosphoglycerate dehydrogenase / 2-oxoglutarate reductase
MPVNPAFVRNMDASLRWHDEREEMSEKIKVLIADKMDPRAAAIFRDRGIEIDEKPGLSPDELKAVIGNYDGLAVRSSTRVTAPVMDAALPRLKVIGRAGIGVDTIDVPAASARGIVVMNTPFGNSITTAEHAIAMLFALAREIPQADQSTQSGKWEKSRFMGVELAGKTLGLIGCGNIGSIVADRAHGLKMKVVAYDPFLSPERAVELGVDKVELDELLARADFLTLHTPLTDQTRGILSREALAKTKPGVRIVNCARGGLIDEAALKDGLDSGHVAGAALDVFAEEPAKENPLFGTRGLICTPHLGASTTEAQVNVAIQVAEQMADFLLLGGITNAVNVPSLSAEEAPRLRPYMALAEKLGRLVGQVVGPDIRSIDVEVEGAAAGLNIKPITGAVLAGVMRSWSDTVNMVNAPYLAKERGLDVREIRSSQEGDYHTLVAVTAGTDEGPKRVEGTLFGNRAPRLVSIFGIGVEADLAGQMIYIVNTDEPGFIGALGTALGEHKVNIATFNLGRREEGGEAVALVAVDDPIATELASQLHRLPGVREVVPLSF